MLKNVSVHKDTNSYLSKNVNYAHKYEGRHFKQRKKKTTNPNQRLWEEGTIVSE